MKCDFCGGDHPNGHCSFQNNSSEEKAHYIGNQGRQGEEGPFQQQQPLYPSSQERTGKLDDALEKFMQASLSNNVVIQSLETQMGQIAQ